MSKFVLEQNEIEEYIVQVITGKKMFLFMDDVYAVKFPDIEVRDRARLVYLKAYKRFASIGVPSMREMKATIVANNLLPRNHYAKIASLEAEIKALDDARGMSTSKSQVAELAYKMEVVRKKLYDMKMVEYGLLVHTSEMRADDIRTEFLVSRCTLKGEELDELMWDKYSDFQNDQSAKFILEAKSSFLELNRGLSGEIIRALARSEDWRRRWKASKQTGTTVFNGSSANWDINKVEICYWSDFYDNIFSYHTPPPDEIIEDDDKLFEWIRNVNRLNSSNATDMQTSESGVVRNEVRTPYKIRPKTQNEGD